MEYQGYEIKADVKTYEIWALDDYGNLGDWESNQDGADIVGYMFENEKTGDHFSSYQYISGEHELSRGEIHKMVDDRIAELAEKAAA